MLLPLPEADTDIMMPGRLASVSTSVPSRP